MLIKNNNVKRNVSYTQGKSSPSCASGYNSVYKINLSDQLYFYSSVNRIFPLVIVNCCIFFFQSLFNLLEFRRLVLNYKPPSNAQDLPRNQKVKFWKIFEQNIYDIHVLLSVLAFGTFDFQTVSDLNVNPLISTSLVTSYS